MAFQLSPGVNVSEIDLTTIVPSGATSIGAFAGPFAWGPVGEIITISDEVKTCRYIWQTRLNIIMNTGSLLQTFLRTQTILKLFVLFGAATKNAVANGTSVLIKNDDDWLENYS
jgi:hypothetical protein